MDEGQISQISNGMKRIDLIGLLLLLCFSCQESTPVDNAKMESQEYMSTSPFLIEAAEVDSIVGKPGYKLIDFRKRAEYEQGHIPGAIHIWRDDLEDSTFAYSGMMPSRKQLETLMGQHGIATEDCLVIYDDNGMCNSARLWWIFQNYDHDKVRLLHGGIQSWNDMNGELSTEEPLYPPAKFVLNSAPSMKFHLDMEQVRAAADRDFFLLDTRTADEFSGKRQKRGASRAGHIPGSVHIDWAEAINYNTDMKLKGLKELREVYSALPSDVEAPIIVYCHSGVRSAHTTFVLTYVLGYQNVRNYDGSWTEWSHLERLPIEADSTLQITS